MSCGEACASLLEAIEANRTDILKSILDHLRQEPQLLAEVWQTQCCSAGTLLHAAVAKGSADAVRAMLLAGADPGAVNSSGQTALATLSLPSFKQSPSEESQQRLLQPFVDEMFRCIAAADLDRMKALLAAGLTLEMSVDASTTRNSALHWAASFGTAEVVSALIREHAADVNGLNAAGWTPLHDAVERGDAAIVSALLNGGADPDLAIHSGKMKGCSARDMALSKPALAETFSLISSTSAGTNGTVGLEVDINRNQDPQLPGSPEITAVHTPLKQPAQHNYDLPQQELPALVVQHLNQQELDPMLQLLWPRPQFLHQLAGPSVPIPPHLQLVVCGSAHRVLDIFQLYRDELAACGHSATVKSFDPVGVVSAGPGELQITLNTSEGRTEEKEAYSLALTVANIKLTASDLRGIQQGLVTLLQLLWLYRGRPSPQLVIRDRPSLLVRGVLLDLASYGRLPTMDTFFQIIRTLARVKINQIYLYCRVSVGPDWPVLYPAADLISLDRECHDRQLALFPALDVAQPCHFSQLNQYTPVFSRLVSCFTNQERVHLGPGLSALIFTAAKTQPQILQQVGHLLGLPSTTRLLLCSNSLPHDSSLLEQLPSNMSLVDYGFQDGYPFLSNGLHLVRSGCDVIPCPGTGAWNCLIGRPDNMTANIRAAALAATHINSSGLLVANWAGSPALCHWAAALPGWLMAAGLAWNLEGGSLSPATFGSIVGRHGLMDESGVAGEVLLELGRAEEGGGVEGRAPAGGGQLQTTRLMALVLSPAAAVEGLTIEQLASVIQAVRRGLSRLQQCREGGGGEGEGLLQEVMLGGELLLVSARLARSLLGCPAPATLASLQPTFRTDIANKLLALIEQYRAVWLSRYLPGGMQASLLHLTSLLHALLPESEKFRAA